MAQLKKAKLIAQQWQRLLGAALDFANDIRAARKMKPLKRLPDRVGANDDQCHLACAIGGVVHMTHLVIETGEKTGAGIYKRLPGSLAARSKLRNIKNYDGEPACEIVILLPDMIKQFIKAVDLRSVEVTNIYSSKFANGLTDHDVGMYL